MDQTQLKRESLSYKHDRAGFTLYYKGQPIGGLGAIKEMHIVDDQSPEAKKYEKIAKKHIERILNGNLGNYKMIIESLDTVFNPPTGSE